MQLIIDFAPLLIAFIAYKKAGIYAATVAFMVLLPMIPIGQKLLGKPVSQFHVWSAVTVILFGGATLIFRDPQFIMVKPSILYGAAGLVLLFSQVFTEQTLIERTLKEAVTLDRPLWQRLNIAWVLFFFFLAALNLYVAFSYSEAFWFKFKVFGSTGIMFAFLIAQAFWIAWVSDEEEETE
ncbi:MAG: inner membrane-spanning protein YciB [Woeseiaceae bacterium]